jgi:Fe-S oxidoreductase
LPDKERLFAPLKHKWSAVRLFCSGCGQYLEVTRETLGDLMVEMGADEMPDPSDAALIITACPCCKPELGFHGPTIVHRQ